MRMYHPDTGAEVTVPDDEACVAVHTASGWLPAPTPEAEPGRVPEPVTTRPKTKPKTDPAAAGAQGDDD